MWNAENYAGYNQESHKYFIYVIKNYMGCKGVNMHVSGNTPLKIQQIRRYANSNFFASNIVTHASRPET